MLTVLLTGRSLRGLFVVKVILPYQLASPEGAVYL